MKKISQEKIFFFFPIFFLSYLILSYYSLYGKLLEDPRRRTRVRQFQISCGYINLTLTRVYSHFILFLSISIQLQFCSSRSKYAKYVKKASFQGRKIISEKCVLVRNKATRIQFAKPLFMG